MSYLVGSHHHIITSSAFRPPGEERQGGDGDQGGGGERGGGADVLPELAGEPARRQQREALDQVDPPQRSAALAGWDNVACPCQQVAANEREVEPHDEGAGPDTGRSDGESQQG